MKTKQEYISSIAEISTQLNAMEWNDTKRFFTPTLQAMARDSARWLENQWKAPNGNTTPIERAVVVLTQDLIVLLGHAANAKIQHELITKLAQNAIQATEHDIIEDPSHRDYFTHPDSPLHSILNPQDH